MLKSYRVKKSEYLDAFAKKAGLPAETILRLNAWLDYPYFLTQGDLLYLPAGTMGQEEEEEDTAPEEDETAPEEEEETAPEEEETAPEEEETAPEEVETASEEEEETASEEEEEAVEPPDEPEEEEPSDSESSGWFSSAAMDVIAAAKKTGVIPAGINSLSDVEKLAVAKALPAAASLILPKLAPKPQPGGVKQPQAKAGAKLPGKAAAKARLATPMSPAIPAAAGMAAIWWFFIRKKA